VVSKIAVFPRISLQFDCVEDAVSQALARTISKTTYYDLAQCLQGCYSRSRGFREPLTYDLEDTSALKGAAEWPLHTFLSACNRFGRE